MKLSVLIAEPRDIIRVGLRAILDSDERIADIYEVSSKDMVKTYLRSKDIHLVIIHQSLIMEVSELPAGRFVIVTTDLDIGILQEAYKYKAKGYLLEHTSGELIRTILSLPDGAFLIEPTIAAQVIDYFSSDRRFHINDEYLTPREREIITLLRKGIDRHTIAKNLSISEATLKTHIKNIARKKEERHSFTARPASRI